jgi:membrane protein YdbS with pleckstrin-like domain
MIYMEEESFVRELMRIPGVDERRAKSLYEAGYTELEHFRDAIVLDLNMVPSINPTLARRIINHFQKKHTSVESTIMVSDRTVSEPYRAVENTTGYMRISDKVTGVWSLRYFLLGAFYIWSTVGLMGLMLLFLIGPLLFIISIGLTLIMIVIAMAYAGALYNSFRYRFEEKNITIERGVFFKRKSVIPYDRIQNVNIIQGPLERMYALKTVEVETAGSSRMMYGGMPSMMFSVAEGLIPGMTEPEKLSNAILARKESFGSGL